MPDLHTHPITPLLVYEDIEAAQAFLVRAFGLTPGRLDRDQDDRVVHGEIDQLYGRWEYEARDLENHRWWFGTPII